MSTTIVLAVLIIFAYHSKKDKERIIEKYQKDIKELNEKIDGYRIQMHETKNQFLTVSTMIKNENSKTKKYIDNIVKNDFEPDEAVQFLVRYIPLNSLKSLVYNKIKKANDNNIKVDVFIDSEARKFDFSQFTISDEYDFTRIIGVFFDNAIEECIEKDFKSISLSMQSKSNGLSIELSNPINTTIDKNKIFEKGFTTKEHGHGYGLALVKKILQKNKKFKHDLDIFEDCLIQRIIIKRQKQTK